ncbi:MAG: hypothetical protein PHQ47_01375 [Candidatus Portnoybacteria bacterium]|nr:hypothetical protein [Candidatus Portnoybacteria bacterium]
MKRIRIMIGLVALVAMASGCAVRGGYPGFGVPRTAEDKTTTKVAAGTAFGAGLGGAVAGWPGMALGSIAGMAAGGLASIGDQDDPDVYAIKNCPCGVVQMPDRYGRPITTCAPCDEEQPIYGQGAPPEEEPEPTYNRPIWDPPPARWEQSGYYGPGVQVYKNRLVIHRWVDRHGRVIYEKRSRY